ncbi:acyl-CoA thioesterase [Rhodococcus sp. MSC1_016]|jgi:acyl-CoA thioester hydrolase|uniref:acyl-CoA thioesterase n=1 Tax=Rhodococcus sp. MSC1_016 TaxID=2909266 RepID=UPI00202F9ABB|nr:acyl-CoA thioesterase [Rhodococcus sp. MSC1_016]
MGTSQVIGIPLRWNDVDAYRHVSHVALVAILDDGRGRWLDSVVGSLLPGWGYVVARLELDFRAPASLGERVLFGSFAVEHIGSSSIRLQERLTTDSGTVVVEAVSVIVAWDQDEAVGRPLTGAEKAALAEQSASLSPWLGSAP